MLEGETMVIINLKPIPLAHSKMDRGHEKGQWLNPRIKRSHKDDVKYLDRWSECLEIMWFAAAKSLQSSLTLCNPIDGSPPGCPIPGILQARVLEWGAIAFSECDLKEGYKNHLGDSLPPLYAECLFWELCNFLLQNKSYSVTTMSVCMFMDSILWLRGQQLGILSHLLGACLEILNAYSR